MLSHEHLVLRDLIRHMKLADLRFIIADGGQKFHICQDTTLLLTLTVAAPSDMHIGVEDLILEAESKYQTEVALSLVYRNQS